MRVRPFAKSAGLAPLLALAATLPAWAQAPTAKPPATAALAAAAPAASAVPAAAPKAKPAPSRCMRLPLSDIAVGRDETIAQARLRLGEYAESERAKRGWGKLTKSAEKIECDVYLVLPLIGTEYKCLVTATFCSK